MTTKEESSHEMVRKPFHNCWRGGFTLVELMVVVSIVAILAVVATPAYVNYLNRTKQGQAVTTLMTARLEQEEFFADNGHYASTIQCLPSFGNTCGGLNAKTVNYYSFSVPQLPGATNFQVAASRSVASTVDTLIITATADNPTIVNPGALKWSLFQWLFQ